MKNDTEKSNAPALAVDEGSALFVWCAEAPDYPGYYALKEPRMLGKLGELGQELGTPNIHEAIHFKTREECETWINGNHLWKATEHGLWVRQNQMGIMKSSNGTPIANKYSICHRVSQIDGNFPIRKSRRRPE